MGVGSFIKQVLDNLFCPLMQIRANGDERIFCKKAFINMGKLSQRP